MTITGTVNDELEAKCVVQLRDKYGSAHNVEAVIDTGFNGFLTLPPSAVVDIELRFVGQSTLELANGEMEDFNLYAVDVFWNGDWKAIDVECTESDSLLGMAFLEQSRLTINVLVGGRVTIDCSI